MKYEVVANTVSAQPLAALRRFVLIALLIALVASICDAQTKQRWVLLPETEAEHARQLCCRPGPPKFSETWKPTEQEIQTMEACLHRISRLRIGSGILGVRIKHPDLYYRQYLGIVIKDRKYIFINAFCDGAPPEFWGQTLIDTCDGGCSWGVVYDVVTQNFSHLEMNGVA